MRVVVQLVVCLIVLSSAEAWAQLRSQTVVTGLQQPLGFVQDPTDRLVQFVLQKGGRIRVVRDGVLLPTDFVNLTGQVADGQEQGLLGLAFAPDYAKSGRFFINFTNRSSNTVVARYRRSENPLVADAGSRFDLRFGNTQRFIDRPAEQHNGGHLAFGPDGYLYIGLGDGSVSNDPDHNAQSPNSLLGKMLRIDVNVPDSDERGYTIPPDNPFLGDHPARDEIWAFGLRNPWKYSFDDVTMGGTGALIIADVGQSHYEEINYEPRGRGGRNYGWRNREGKHSNEEVPNRPLAFPATDPIFDYPRTVGRSITGGFVYRGRRLGEGYRGRYFFADYVMGKVWSIALAIDGSGEAAALDFLEHTAELGGRAVIGSISSIGVDADGELYLVNLGSGSAGGSIIRIDGPPIAPPDPTGFKIIKR